MRGDFLPWWISFNAAIDIDDDDIVLVLSSVYKVSHMFFSRLFRLCVELLLLLPYTDEWEIPRSKARHRRRQITEISLQMYYIQDFGDIYDII